MVFQKALRSCVFEESSLIVEGLMTPSVLNSGAGFLWFGFASCSTGRCSGPSTLINVMGKRNLNGINFYLR